MDSGPVKIYSSIDSPRLRYISGILLGDILGLSWDIITDKRKLGKHPVINYSTDKITGSFTIKPSALLFGKGISPQNIEPGDWRGLPVFYLSGNGWDLPFDIFAASFFLITRYEEYLESEHDKYDRFKASSSIAFKYGFLDKPIVDLWAMELAKALLRVFPNLVFRRNEYSALLTIDTDQPFALLGKNIFRAIGGFFRERDGLTDNVGERYRIMTKEEKDPYDVFDYMIENIDKNEVDSIFFFPVGDQSRFDKNPSWKNEEYRKLILKISGRYQTGLHPSFAAGDDGSHFENEAARLQAIIGRNISLSRFHYIRLFMPRSYINAIKTGITEDYSMGYPEEPGFRAGIARPFMFYNTVDDVQTNLKIIPFQIMDGTLYDYKKLDPAGSKEVILRIISETRKAGGVFVSIWHNTSLLDNAERKNWREVFEFMIKNQKP
jgi:hypothetical protein